MACTRHIVVTPSSVHGRLICFHVGAAVNKSAMDTNAQVTFRVLQKRILIVLNAY